jgi:hypothetical protein
MKEMLAKGNRTRPGRQLEANIQALHAAVKQAKVRGGNQKYLNELESEGKNALRKQLWIDQEAEGDRLRVELEKQRIRWESEQERRLEKDDIRTRNFERRLNAMSDAEVRETALRPPMEPGLYDALCAECVTRQFLPEHDLLRKRARELRIYEPWTNVGEGAAIMRELELNAHVQGGGVLLDLVGQDGKPTTGSASIDDLWEVFQEADHGEE